MAVYKLEIKKRLGKFQAQFNAHNVNGKMQDFEDLNDVLDFVREQVTPLDLNEHSVIFRSIAYPSLAELERAVKDAPY
ncbi:MAG: hypothetical protein RBU37_11990 [Myxococcota bacterium]|jgi:hypothetical protein|nr:hypothetical protein [Myxococcota bacterium]